LPKWVRDLGDVSLQTLRLQQNLCAWQSTSGMFIIDAKFHHGSTWYGALFNLGYTESALFQFSYVEKPCVCGAVKKPLPSTFRVVCGLAVSLFSFSVLG
jgi:hypothetical protein